MYSDEAIPFIEIFIELIKTLLEKVLFLISSMLSNNKEGDDVFVNFAFKI